MTTTINIELTGTWAAIAGAGELLVTAHDPADRVEYALSETGAPAATMQGHYIDRSGDLALTLTVNEVLYVRTKGPDIQIGTLTADNPIATAV